MEVGELLVLLGGLTQEGVEFLVHGLAVRLLGEVPDHVVEHLVQVRLLQRLQGPRLRELPHRVGRSSTQIVVLKVGHVQRPVVPLCERPFLRRNVRSFLSLPKLK